MYGKLSLVIAAIVILSAIPILYSTPTDDINTLAYVNEEDGFITNLKTTSDNVASNSVIAYSVAENEPNLGELLNTSSNIITILLNDNTPNANITLPKLSANIPWLSEDHYRVDVVVNPNNLDASGLPVKAYFDFSELLLILNAKGTFDRNSIRIVGYNPISKVPTIVNPDFEGFKKYEIQYRFDEDYDGYSTPRYHDSGNLSWVLKSADVLQTLDNMLYSIYFDTLENGPKKPMDYVGLIGDGDPLKLDYGPLTVGSYCKPILVDWDEDGDNDFVIGSSESIKYFENVGNNSAPVFVNRGELRDKYGKNLNVNYAEKITNVSGLYNNPTLMDVDGDGKRDLLVGILGGTIYWFKNIGDNKNVILEPKGNLTGKNREVLRISEGDEWLYHPYNPDRKYKMGPFSTIFPYAVDFDNDGDTDILAGTTGGRLYLFENDKGFLPAVKLNYLDGSEIKIGMDSYSTICDWDGDGDTDILVGELHGFVTLIENIGTGKKPVLKCGGRLKTVDCRDVDAGIMSAPLCMDFDLDGDIDLLIGDHVFGQISYFKNINPNKKGTPQLVSAGYISMKNPDVSMYQGRPALIDINNDGRNDFLSGHEFGHIYSFENIGTNNEPLFKEFMRLEDQNGTVTVMGGTDPFETDEVSYSRVITVDWDRDGRLDVISGEDMGNLNYYKNIGPSSSTDFTPKLLYKGKLVDEAGNLLKVHHRSSPSFGDLDNDGKPELVAGGCSVYINDSDVEGYSSHIRIYEITYKSEKGEPTLSKPRDLYYLDENGKKHYEFPRRACPIVADFDGDGIVDLISRTDFYKNIGTDSDGLPILLPGVDIMNDDLCKYYIAMYPIDTTVADLNNDGDMDFFVCSEFSYIHYFEKSYLKSYYLGRSPIVSVVSASSAKNSPVPVNDKGGELRVYLLSPFVSCTDEKYLTGKQEISLYIDGDSAISECELRINGKKVESAFESKRRLCTYLFDSKAFPEGDLQLSLVVRDVLGNIGHFSIDLKNSRKIDLMRMYQKGELSIDTDMSYEAGAFSKVAAFDGSVDLLHSARKDGFAPAHYTIDLKKKYKLSRFGICLKPDFRESVTVYCSIDGRDWHKLCEYSDAVQHDMQYTDISPSTDARYVKIEITSSKYWTTVEKEVSDNNSWPCISEIELFGVLNDTDNYDMLAAIGGIVCLAAVAVWLYSKQKTAFGRR